MSTFELRRTTRRFGPLVALHDASFAVQDGGCFVLPGQTGAGKITTLSAYDDLAFPPRAPGRNPSGGQMQRVAVGRACLAPPTPQAQRDQSGTVEG